MRRWSPGSCPGLLGPSSAADQFSLLDNLQSSKPIHIFVLFFSHSSPVFQVSIVGFLLSVSSSSRQPEIPHFSKEAVAHSVKTVVDGFMDAMYTLLFFIFNTYIMLTCQFSSIVVIFHISGMVIWLKQLLLIKSIYSVQTGFLRYPIYILLHACLISELKQNWNVFFYYIIFFYR